MGYFAYAQYDVKEKYVILNEVKNPTEELTSIYLFTLVVGYFAYAQYDVKSPIGDYAAHNIRTVFSGEKRRLCANEKIF